MTADLDQAVRAAHERYARTHPRSARAQQRALAVLPGGNTRSVLHFEPFPFRAERAEGAELVDIDGHRYVDFCGNYSAGLLGHEPEAVRAALRAALDDGMAIGATREQEIDLAERICRRFPGIDQVRFTNSGTEANLMAVGLALHHTGRRTVGVFDHGYHGGLLAFGELDAPESHPLNVPHPFRLAPFDDVSGLDELFAEPDLACVLVEMVQGSGGCRPASPVFLAELRRRCTEHGALLIVDEVMTSRLSPGGAQELLGVVGDLTTLGKYLGGGLSFGAFGGRRDIMAAFDPAAGGRLTQAGTFNNNAMTMAAALAVMDAELTDARLSDVNERGDRLRVELNDRFGAAGIPLWVTGLGSMLAFHSADDRILELFFHDALEHGLYFARRGFMALSMEITDAHTAALVDFASDWCSSQTGSARS
ncbi:MAG: aminotransferase class III-fold pyridoxal phosphate-dependent enzyme [Ilumatobacteraceae bacterium]